MSSTCSIDPYDFIATSFCQTVWRYTQPQYEPLKEHLQHCIGVMCGNRKMSSNAGGLKEIKLRLDKLQSGVLIGELIDFCNNHLDEYKNDEDRKAFLFMAQQISNLIIHSKSTSQSVQLLFNYN